MKVTHQIAANRLHVDDDIQALGQSIDKAVVSIPRSTSHKIVLPVDQHHTVSMVASADSPPAEFRSVRQIPAQLLPEHAGVPQILRSRLP